MELSFIEQHLKNIKTILALTNVEFAEEFFADAEIFMQIKDRDYDLIICDDSASFTKLYYHCHKKTKLLVFCKRHDAIRLNLVKAGFNHLYEEEGFTLAHR